MNYYEEKFFKGDWWYRVTPMGTFYKFDYERLLKKAIELEEQLNAQLEK
jgi:hypothetical protein